MKINFFTLTLLCSLPCVFTCCTNTKSKPADQNLVFLDSNSNHFSTIPPLSEIKIGEQSWDAANLQVTHFKNGDLIPNAISAEEWEKAGALKKPAWCYYQNDSSNNRKYGKLYNWFAVNDKRGLAPTGWHIASDTEWGILITYLGGEAVTGAKIKSNPGWKDNGNGTNASGFTAVPGGYRFKNGVFNAEGYFGSWWTSTANSKFSAWFYSLRYDDNGIYRNNFGKEDGYAVRCIRN